MTDPVPTADTIAETTAETPVVETAENLAEKRPQIKNIRNEKLDPRQER